MRWWNNIMDRIRSRITIRPADASMITINASMDFESNAAKNRIWYRGDSLELSQLYSQLGERANLQNFWSAKSSPGMQMRKIHTGLPGVIIDTLSSVVLTDLNEISLDKNDDKENWEMIAMDNKLEKLLEGALKEVLCVGDGAFKITFDSEESDYPIIEFYPGDEIDFVESRGRLKEIIFRTPYLYKGQQYILHETYGYGYIKNRLTKDGKEIDLNYLPETKNLTNYFFAGYAEGKDGETLSRGEYMLAVPLMIYRSTKYKGRGKSIIDGKTDAFDSLDEAWSQWMDALRAGRSKTYIPDNLLPRNPETGAVLKPNPFDNQYIQTDADLRETQKSTIVTDHPVIPHDSYMSTYCTALDLCLQGIISPSTIGIDVKKLDNAEAQREKEKATLYTRNAIIETLTEDLKLLVSSALNAYYEFNGQKIREIDPDVSFGEYANPSFESQVETVGKGKTQGIMSIEACVDELYGDSKDEEWKKEEVARLKNEQGIMEAEEPAVNVEAGSFATKGDFGDDSANSKEKLPDEPEASQKAPGADE